MEMTTLLAVLPFALIFCLIVVFRVRALKVMPIAWLLTVFLTFFVWKTDPSFIKASFIKGAFVTSEIMLIIFGAVFFLEIFRQKGKLKELNSLLFSISEDARIQAIIIGWLFGSLIEGIAGFGTPAVLAAPLLVSLGFSPILAVVVALIGNSTAVSFGAVGTPVLLGLGSLGFDKIALQEITKFTAILHAAGSIVVPLAISFFVISSVKKEKIKSFVEIIPFAILSWLSFIVPYFLSAWLLGPEFPSIIGGFSGVLLSSVAARKKFLVPKKIISLGSKKERSRKFSLSSVIPYALIIILLLASRTIGFFRTNLSGVKLQWGGILGTSVSYEFLPFYTPSFYFLIVGIFSLFLFRAKKKEIFPVISRAFDRIKTPFLALLFALTFVQLILISGNNISGIASIPILLAQLFSRTFQGAYIAIAPVIGMFGAFIAGSNTVSNLMFGAFQAEIAAKIGLSIILVLALQTVGGAVGNMIAIHNVLAASSAVNLKHAEGEIIRKTIIVALIYIIIVGLIALLLIK